MTNTMRGSERFYPDVAIAHKKWVKNAADNPIIMANPSFESFLAGVQWHAAPQAQSVANKEILDPDMPMQELRLHMGEISNSESLVAKAAIRWANSAKQPQPVLAAEGDVERVTQAIYGVLAYSDNYHAAAQAAIATMSPKPRKAMNEEDVVEILCVAAFPAAFSPDQQIRHMAASPCTVEHQQESHRIQMGHAYRALLASGAFTNTNGGDDE